MESLNLTELPVSTHNYSIFVKVISVKFQRKLEEVVFSLLKAFLFYFIFFQHKLRPVIPGATPVLCYLFLLISFHSQSR